MAEATKTRRKRNKSAAIRDYLQQHPDAGPTEVARALTEQKIKVSATHVSNVKARLASGAAVGTRGVGRPRKSASFNGGGLSIEMLVEVKKIVDRVGSVENAQRALSALSKLV